jgi:hypothetical protein
VDLQCGEKASQERFLSINYRDAKSALVWFSAGDVTALETLTKPVREVMSTCKIVAVVTESNTS